MTDNRNRTVSEVRRVFTKFGGRLGESGSVNWIFEKKGLFTFDTASVDEDGLMEAGLEAGAEDGAEDVVRNDEDKVFEVYTDPTEFHKVKSEFDSMGLEYTLSEISMIPASTVHVEGGEAVRRRARGPGRCPGGICQLRYAL
jgi:transcriptional/translational regulatory protein YebC/TACO1